MPALGMAQDTGTLIRWLKNEGDTVAKGEPLMEIETDKVTVEVEATASGILGVVTAAPGDVVPVAETIALILAPGESVPKPASAAPSKPQPESVQPAKAQLVTASPVAARIAEQHQIDLSQIKPANGGRITKSDVLAHYQSQAAEVSVQDGGRLIPASPKARRLAAERSIDLTLLAGSGPGGAVIALDVPLTAPVASPTPTAAEAMPAARQEFETSKVWRVMVERLSASWSNVPHFYLVRDVDATALKAWRDHVQSRSDEKITITDLLVKITAAALREHPRANASWDDGRIMSNPNVNVGLAVATEDGLLVPVIHDTDRKRVREIAARRKELVERASAGKLRPDDVQGATFTISNLGMYGVDAFSAIVNPPQAAILAVGRIADRVVPVDGQAVIRPIMTLSLSSDHRVLDGARAAQFLDTLASLIEEPMRLIE
jgi:pyruvate dehydrogenase E2 component (dihydrolipoamide acetyltransferase)